MTKQTSPFILLGLGVIASAGYFYFGPKLFGSKKTAAASAPQPQPPVVLPQPPVGPTSPMIPMGPQTQLPPPRPPVKNSPNITLQNGATPLSPMGFPPQMNMSPQGAMMPPAYPPIKPNVNMNFSGATFSDGSSHGFPLTGF